MNAAAQKSARSRARPCVLASRASVGDRQRESRVHDWTTHACRHIAALIAVAAGAALVSSAVSEPQDKRPPKVSVTAPSARATLSGTVTLAASRQRRRHAVTWSVDGRPAASDTSAPWSRPWNTATVANGGHSAVATAEDGAGNVGTSAAVSFTVDNSSGGAPTGDPVIAAAGDIAGSGSGDDATARLLDAIAPRAVLTTGDNVYDDGTLAEFNSYYDPTWGRHRAVTHPVPGNHEYHTEGAAGYFDYFGAAAGDPARGYYSFDLGAWHPDRPQLGESLTTQDPRRSPG